MWWRRQNIYILAIYRNHKTSMREKKTCQKISNFSSTRYAPLRKQKQNNEMIRLKRLIVRWQAVCVCVCWNFPHDEKRQQEEEEDFFCFFFSSISWKKIDSFLLLILLFIAIMLERMRWSEPQNIYMLIASHLKVLRINFITSHLTPFCMVFFLFLFCFDLFSLCSAMPQ